MEKSKFEGFINRYSLAGEIESVIINSEKDTLSVKMISDDKSLLGSVSMENKSFPEGRFGVYTTSQLKQLLSVLDDDITVNATEYSLKFNDKGTRVNYMLAKESIIPKVPETKRLPDFDIEVKLNSDFISKFIKSKSALAEADSFTFTSKGKKAQVILGYSTSNSNMISLDVESNVTDNVKPISFSAKYLKNILLANKESSDAVLRISTEGLAHVKFDDGTYKSEYYLMEVGQ